MSIKDVIKNSVYESLGGGTNLSAKSILLLLVIAALVGLYIFAVYKLSSKSAFYSKDLNITLAGMPIIVAAIMIAMQSNLLVSLGMVGALSIVRFRTAVKDSRDTMFIFWAMAEGLCVSSRNWRMTFTTVLFIAAVLILSSRVPGIRNKYLLIVSGGEQAIDRKQFEEKLKPYVVSFRVRTANKNAEYEEMICEIGTKGEINPDVLDALLSVPGIQSVNWVVQSGETVG